MAKSLRLKDIDACGVVDALFVQRRMQPPITIWIASGVVTFDSASRFQFALSSYITLHRAVSWDIFYGGAGVQSLTPIPRWTDPSGETKLYQLSCWILAETESQEASTGYLPGRVSAVVVSGNNWRQI